MSESPTTSARLPAWSILTFASVVGLNLLASATTYLTIGLMRGVSEFAGEVREFEVAVLQYYTWPSYVVVTAALLWYLRPILAFWRQPAGTSPPAIVERRAIGAPLVVGGMSFAGWLFSIFIFPALTVYRFGHWSGDLMSQQVLSPLVNGFLAATTSYFVVDWIFRAHVIPRVFPSGGLGDVPGTVSLGVRARLLVFLLAVAFTPLFTMLGLVRATLARVQAGRAVDQTVPALSHASSATFLVYAVLGIALTLLLARLLTRPLGEMAAALRRVQAGDLGVEVSARSSDEVGVLLDGVNRLVETLRERQRILQAFGRVVEPFVRDRLLAGDLQVGGEVRMASVLFCDLRGFTAFAERTPPREVVATLNQFFTAMTAHVRASGGFVDKFIGDAFLVVFGLFDEGEGGRGRAAAAAVGCAVGMRERLAQLNDERERGGQIPLGISVAIHTGEVLAGTIGAEDRHEYTVIGDTVNVAARLQQLGKERNWGVVVSQATYELARSHGFRGEATPCDAVTLRGRNQPVQVFLIG